MKAVIKLILMFCAGLLIATACNTKTTDPPNILWLTCEDISPHLGSYGDPDAWTPHLDALAERGIRFTNAYAPAPVCTPARSSIITGVYASSMGTMHLRGPATMSDEIRCFTGYLREAGYYCSNNVKEDYNFETPEEAWDESSNTAHWRGRAEGQPFFSVFNYTGTHQSRTRYLQEQLEQVNQSLAPEEQHDPASLELPPYYPDTEIVRQNMAALHTQITLMDKWVQNLLDQLEEDGLSDNTIVFFYSDHGDGLPRGKRWIHATGTRVPMIIHLPGKYRYLSDFKPGSVNDELVNFVDLAPTVLSLAGLEIPVYMQGMPILGEEAFTDRQYLFAIRDRIDEVLEFSRSVRTEDFHYIRNFYPHRPRMQRSFYSERTPLRQEIRRLHAAGQLTGMEAWLMAPEKPAEELYDTGQDPLELNNLADDPEYHAVKDELMNELFNWMVETRDLALLPEAEMHRRAGDRSPYEMAQNPDEYPVEKILAVAGRVGMGDGVLYELQSALEHEEMAVRYWGAVGLAALGEKAAPATEDLKRLLDDEYPSVRFAAAEALCNLGYVDEGIEVLATGLSHDDPRTRLLAVQILVAMGQKAAPAAGELEKLTDAGPQDGALAWYMSEAASWLLSVK